MSERPRVNSKGQQELDKVADQFEDYSSQIRKISDNVTDAPQASDYNPSTKISAREAHRAARIMKPTKTIGSKERFNEAYRGEYEEAKKYVTCIVENFEFSGKIDCWTKPFPGMPAEYWELPCGTPIIVHRYVADRISQCSYRRLSMDDTPSPTNYVESDRLGAIVVAETKRRLDARPVGSAFVAMGS